MSITRPLAIAALLAVAVVPVHAAPFCLGTGSGLQFEFGISIGKLSNEDRNELDLMVLRRRGVDATRVERWNGCLRAFVRQPGGGEIMEYYDPDTYQRVY
jgi:hypothetical protein